MSRLIRGTTEGEEAITSATEETILQVRGVTTLKTELAEFSLSGDQEPTTSVGNIQWRLLYQTSDGTASGGTELAQDPDDPTSAMTMFTSFSSTEPTASTVIAEGEIPANGEVYRYWADGEGPVVDSATSSRIGLTALSSVSINVKAHWAWRIVTG